MAQLDTSIPKRTLSFKNQLTLSEGEPRQCERVHCILGALGFVFFVLVRCATLLRALYKASFEVGERLWFWSLTDVLSLSCKYLTSNKL